VPFEDRTPEVSLSTRNLHVRSLAHAGGLLLPWLITCLVWHSGAGVSIFSYDSTSSANLPGPSSGERFVESNSRICYVWGFKGPVLTVQHGEISDRGQAFFLKSSELCNKLHLMAHDSP